MQPKMMPVVTSLTGQVTEQEYFDPHGVRSTVLVEPQPGWFLQFKMGSSGLLIHHNHDDVAIPLAVLVALAMKAYPKLQPPPEVKPPAVANDQN